MRFWQFPRGFLDRTEPLGLFRPSHHHCRPASQSLLSTVNTTGIDAEAPAQALIERRVFFFFLQNGAVISLRACEGPIEPSTNHAH